MSKFAKIYSFKEDQVLIHKDYRQKEEDHKTFLIVFHVQNEEATIVKSIGFPEAYLAEELFDLIDEEFAKIYLKASNKFMLDRNADSLAQIIVNEYKKRLTEMRILKQKGGSKFKA